MNTEVNFGWILNDDRIAVKQEGAEKKSKGGIIIPDTAQEKNATGTIVAIGERVWWNDETMARYPNMPFFVGQKVMFGKYAGSEMKGDDGEEYMVMREHDITGWKPKNQ